MSVLHANLYYAYVYYYTSLDRGLIGCLNNRHPYKRAPLPKPTYHTHTPFRLRN